MSPSGEDYVLSCPGSNSVIINNGEDGANGQNGQDGTDGATCSVSANADASYTLTCDGSAPVTFTNGAPVGGGGDDLGAPCALTPNSKCMSKELEFMWLGDMNLSGVNFSNSEAEFARFDNSNLAGANFYSTILDGAVMTHVDLTDAVFIDARAVRVNFNDATLDGVNFNGAAIADSTFGNASLIGATFVNATAGNSSGGAEFLSANLTCAHMDAAVTSKQVTWTNATCPDGTLANATTGCTGKLTRGASCP